MNYSPPTLTLRGRSFLGGAQVGIVHRFTRDYFRPTF